MTTKTIFFSVILLAVSISLVFGTSYAIEAEKAIELVPEPTETENSIEAYTINFKEFTTDEMVNYSIKAQSNPEVAKLLGSDFKYDGASYELTPEPNRMTMVYSTPEGYDVYVSFEDGEISNIEKIEQVKWGYVNGYVNKIYDSSTDLKGIGHDFETPSTYGTSNSGWVALLSNGVKDGSDTVNDDLCDSSSSPDTYWAQSGVQFDDSSIKPGYTDTEYDCVAKYFALTVSAGDEVVSRVYLDDSVANKWWMTVDVIGDAYAPYGFTRTVSGSTELLKGDFGTGVFFENPNNPDHGWDADFGSDIVSDWASYKDTSNNNWYLWGSEDEDYSFCKPTANPTSVTSGAFDTGDRDVTWDVSDIDDDCGKGWY